MGKQSDNPTREERLAARLRENLRRRKAQARAINASENGDSAPETRANPSQSEPQ